MAQSSNVNVKFSGSNNYGAISDTSIFYASKNVNHTNKNTIYDDVPTDYNSLPQTYISSAEGKEFKSLEEIEKEENNDIFSGEINFLKSETSKTKNKKQKNINNKKIWSSFYGGSAKHTKDHLGMFFNQIAGGLKLDKDSRYISYDKDGNKYEKGIYKDEDGNVIKESALVKFQNKANSIVNKITGKDTTGAWAEFNNKYKKSKPSHSNEYRVGQNWAYGSVTLVDEYVGWEGNALQAKGSIGNDQYNLNGEFDLLHAEAQAGYELGPDHFVASASAEASLIHAEGSGKATFYEDKYMKAGASANVKADVCKAYANGKIGAGFYTKEVNGKKVTYLDAGIQGSVGADLCSATASGTVNAGPVDITGVAAVKIGIGAQANIGFEEGKFNVHLGLAVGIGVELGFSLDISRGLTAVKDGAKKVWNFVTFWD